MSLVPEEITRKCPRFHWSGHFRLQLIVCVYTPNAYICDVCPVLAIVLNKVGHIVAKPNIMTIVLEPTVFLILYPSPIYCRSETRHFSRSTLVCVCVMHTVCNMYASQGSNSNKGQSAKYKVCVTLMQ